MNNTEQKYKERGQKMNDAMTRISDSLDKNLIGLEFLRDILSQNEERVYIDDKDGELVVKGSLANYKLPMGDITKMLENPFLQSGSFPRTKVHPTIRFVDEPGYACIQPASLHETLPGTDSIGVLVLGLLNDKELFMDDSQDSLRKELIRTYGFCKSPISEIIAEYIEGLGGVFDLEEGEITVRGTDGFHWVIGSMVDPSVESFSISSYVRSGPRRMHTMDTYHDMSRCRNLDYLVRTLSLCPRLMIDDGGTDGDLVYSEKIVRSVALVHAPLRRALKEGNAVGSDYFERCEN